MAAPTVERKVAKTAGCSAGKMVVMKAALTVVQRVGMSAAWKGMMLAEKMAESMAVQTAGKMVAQMVALTADS